MKLIFGTTNKRKKEDLENIIKEMKLNIEVLDMDDIGWNRGEIKEDGATIEENSLIKANALLSFCKDYNIEYPILTDDAGLYVDALNGDPGIYTSRYADKEIEENPSLPKHQCVIKLLEKLKGQYNRKAQYRCCVTIMEPNGKVIQEFGESNGSIATEIIGDLAKPFFYSVFILDGTNVAFNKLEVKELKDTYRYKALRKALNNTIKEEKKYV